MDSPRLTLSPRQIFADNMRPAQLMLQVYQLLDANDRIQTDGEMVGALRSLLHASPGEDVMLIYNELFLGFVRERAQVNRSTLRQTTLQHLLRQSVVASCTALETYLPSLLRAHMPTVIRARGRDFFPREDATCKEYFKEFRFSLDDTLRLLAEDNGAEYISDKMVRFIDFQYLTGERGVHVVGALLGLAKPWDSIAAQLNRNRDELARTLNGTVKRRNNIVHRADRLPEDPGGDAQPITYAWTRQAVDNIEHVSLALNELVTARVHQLGALVDGS